MTDELTIRPATADDYDGVMQIGKLYDGTDYLTALYETFYLHWLSCFVGVINEEIVAFYGGVLIDEGKTILLSGARVKECIRGKGILSKLTLHIHAYLQKIPPINYEVMAISGSNFEKHGNKLQNSRQISNRILVEYFCETLDFKPNATKHDVVGAITEMGTEDLKRLFQSKDMSASLFPEGRILLNWYPFRPLVANIPIMMDRGQFWATINNNLFTTVTSSLTYYVENQLNYAIDVNGDSASEIKNHVAHHIQNINRQINSTCKTICLLVEWKTNMENTEPILSMMDQCGLKETKRSPSKIVLLEKNLSSS